MTEECFQQTPLNFANDFTTIKYYDGTREPFDIKATTTDLGLGRKVHNGVKIQFQCAIVTLESAAAVARKNGGFEIVTRARG